MNSESFRDYCLQKRSVTESFPFGEETLVFKVGNKIFALLALDSYPSTANLKCDPDRAVTLRENFPLQIYPGYHMNKKHWNTLNITQLPENLVRELIDHSYELVVKGLPKKVQAFINAKE
ncbi:MAG: MmcQ/YjbR family DNA-binding protein [Bacteroidetes bacterium]|jgi:predicted DNA-binding protein (MmcQ/YjbR family)|nr:MmcQ/YjbR family DNA-binding protein [Bacteroidota bacterium]